MSNGAYHVEEGFLAIGRTFAEYRRLFDLGVEATREQLHEKRESFVWEFYGDVETRVRYLRDMARVAREEVRVFPLASLDATRSAYVDPVVERLRADGLAIDVREVPYEFQPS